MTAPHWTNAAATLSTPYCLQPNITSNAQDLAVVFGGKKMLDLQKGSGQLFEVHCLVFEAKANVNADQMVVGFATDLTFGYARSAGTRISLLAEVAGSQSTLEFDFLRQAKESELEPLSIHRQFSPQGLRTSGAGQVGSFGPVVPYRLSLLVTIQRESLEDDGHFFLDGIDVSAVVQK